MKLVLHRASLKYYEEYIKKRFGCLVHYVSYDKVTEVCASVFRKTVTSNYNIEVYDPIDHDILKGFTMLSKKHRVVLKVHESPMFLLNTKQLEDYRTTHPPDKGKIYQYSHSTFYKWVRTHLSVLLTKSGKPIGGKWTFDTENRNTFKKGFKETWKPINITTSLVTKAKQYVNKQFNDNPGEMECFYLPIGFKNAKKQLDSFLSERLGCFGKYQDAVRTDVVVGCHSMLSPYLNIGFLTPSHVLEKTLSYYKTNKTSIPISSIEGYIRQVIGWREYTRMLYLYEYKTFSKSNYLSHNHTLESYWYHTPNEKETSGRNKYKYIGYKIPVIRDMIQKVFSHGYLHHIERLMYIGNWMLLTRTKPSEAYKWFLSMFVDAYPWVMCSNVYGMSQFSSGQIMMNRPYFSSSNYIQSMSNYKKNKASHVPISIKLKGETQSHQWYELWDAVYYSFLHKHKKRFQNNYAVARQLKHWDSKSPSEQKRLLLLADTIL
jgi:deoxyribodipyrimidine photolyase-related protein